MNKKERVALALSIQVDIKKAIKSLKRAKHKIQTQARRRRDRKALCYDEVDWALCNTEDAFEEIEQKVLL